jgi:hypothetical protein
MLSKRMANKPIIIVNSSNEFIYQIYVARKKKLFTVCKITRLAPREIALPEFREATL